MKKLLIYMPTFRGGGAERNGALLASEFARRGYRVVLAVDRTEGPNRDLLLDAIEVRGLGDGVHRADIRALRRVLRETRPDVAYARIGISHFKILLAGLGMFSWRRVVLSYHGLYQVDDRLGGRMTYRLSSLLTRLTGATIAVSSDIRTELVSRFGASASKIRVVHNPVDLQWIAAKAAENSPPWLKARRYILSAGRLISQKDYPTLLHAFARICGRIEHDLVIIGEGPLRQDLESQVANLGLSGRVHLPGYLPNPFPVYRDASLFVLSSAYEGFGNVLIEALALGVPVVATRCPGGPKEILEEGKYGPLVPVGDPEALADAMVTTLSYPLSPEILKARAKDFSLDRVADAYLAVSELNVSSGKATNT